MPDDPHFDIERWRNAVTKAVGELLALDGPASDVEYSESANAVSFAVGLLQDRVGPDEKGSPSHRRPDGDAGPEVTTVISPIAARVTLFASVLTQLFFHARAARLAQPLSRWDQDLARMGHQFEDDGIGVDVRERHQIAELQDLAIHHGTRAVDELESIQQSRHHGSADEANRSSALPLKAVIQLLKDISRKLQGSGQGGGVSLSDLRILTEVSWYLLVDGLPEYPGWTELLLGLVFRDRSRSADHARPQFENLRQAVAPFQDLLAQPTQRSWKSFWKSSGSSTDRSTDRTDFYASVARMLWSQQTVGNTATPPSSAFVTSFDLELEMAMWNTAEENAAFYVVVPVHVFPRDSNATTAVPCWLRGEVVKKSDQDGLERIRKPSNWHVLSAATSDDELREGPHVVRLSGSPLVTLPSRGDTEQTGDLTYDTLAQEMYQAGVDSNDVGSIEHALTLDEYLAVHQSEAELLFTTLERTDSETRSLNRALPRFLYTSSSVLNGIGECPRFWMAFGVPIGDAAMRHRLISQIARTRVSLPNGGPNVGRGTPVSSPAAQSGSDVKEPSASRPQGLGDKMSGSTPQADERHPLFFDSISAEHDAGVLSNGDVLRSAEPSHDADNTSADDQLSEGDGTPVVRRRDERHTTAPLFGMIVNRRSKSDEARLLTWVGFDVIRDRASAFTPDLEHYAEHLRRGPEHWPRGDDECDISPVSNWP